jgi:hypothetical protein
MLNRRTLLRHALWALPLALSLGPWPALAQSADRQRELDRRIEQRQQERSLERQQDRNSAQEQLQRQELERRLREQQLLDRRREESRRESLQNQNPRLRDRGI